MVSAIWMTFPPEVHSSLLSGGPGSGPLLAASTAWQGLSIQYAGAQAAVQEMLANVASGIWEGESADQFLRAHEPLVAWLGDVSATNSHNAATHAALAGAYDEALLTMPTLLELITNHIVHAILVATNFFGINTIPIAINEADYMRMWVQAAETMDVYDGQSSVFLSQLRLPSAPPQLINTSGMVSDLVELLGQFSSQTQGWLSEEFSDVANILNDMHALGQQIGHYLFVAVIAVKIAIAAAALFGVSFFVVYQAFFNAIGWPTWGAILGGPIAGLISGVLAGVVGGVTGGVGIADIFPQRSSNEPLLVPTVPITASPPPTFGMSVNPVVSGPTFTSVPPNSVNSSSIAQVSPVGVDSPPSIEGGPTQGFSGQFTAGSTDELTQFFTAALYSAIAVRNDSTVSLAKTDEEAIAELVGTVINGVGSEVNTQPGFMGTASKVKISDPLGLSRMPADRFNTSTVKPMVPSTWMREDIPEVVTPKSSVSAAHKDAEHRFTADANIHQRTDTVKNTAPMNQEKM